MAYNDPLSWSIGDFFNIHDINPSAGYVIQPFGSDIAHVFLRDGTELLVDSEGTIIGFG